MSERNFVGMLLTEEDLSRSEDERNEYAVIKELGEDFKDKTFQEVAEYLTKNKDDMTPRQGETADNVKSSLRQHSENPCHFMAYKDNGGEFKPIRDSEGSENLGIDYKIEPYIDSRTLPTGEEYDCIDMVLGKPGGIQGKDMYRQRD